MAEDAESNAVPECSICFQPYDDSLVIPRVLSCGHSLCECCVSSLVNADSQDDDGRRRPSLLRCPECNHRSKLHDLPKNIELLRFIGGLKSSNSNQTSRPVRPGYYFGRGPSFVYEASIAELCCWIIPPSSARIHQDSSGEVVLCRGEGSLESIRPATFVCLQGECQEGRKVLGSEYRQHVRTRLQRLSGHEVKDFLHLLRIDGGVFGIWMDITNGCLYLVLMTLARLQEFGEHLLIKNTSSMSYFGVTRALKLCEFFMKLHAEHVIAGLLTPSCLCQSDLMHLHLDIHNFLCTRKEFWNSVKSEKFSGLQPPTSIEISDLIGDLTLCFSSPELLWLVQNPDTQANSEISCKTDSWTFACLFCKIFFGETPWDEITLSKFKEISAHCKQHAHSWLEGHVALAEVGPEESITKVMKTITRCFSYSPNERPCISEVWKLLADVPTSSPSVNDTSLCCKAGVGSLASLWCLILGHDICASNMDARVLKKNTVDSGTQPACSEPPEQTMTILTDRVSQFQKSEILEGHHGYITCLAIFGKYLLSSSLDKTICVWSLKDNMLLKCYKGHNQRVMALACSQKSSVFVSGDYGGEMFAWDIELREANCVSKWHHHQDWRYSGISSLAISSDSLLYSGAGDKAIKVWSLQDYSLLGTLEGHKALISALLIDGEILISGSWDGTIRLWWRSDHCPLAILNESIKLGGVLALECTTDLLLVGYESGAIQVWKDEVCINSVSAHDNAISSLCLSGNTVYSGSWDGSIKAWNINELLDNALPSAVVECGEAIKAMVCCNHILFVGLVSKSIVTYSAK